MIKCLQSIVRDGYSATDGAAAFAVALDGGKSRYRQDYLNATATMPIKWIVDPTGYDYLRAFYQSINNGADEFLIDLLFESSGILEYHAHLVPGTFKLSSQSGLTYIVEATLEVIPNGQAPTISLATGSKADVLSVVALAAGVANFNALNGQVFELTLAANCTSSNFLNGVVGTAYTFCIMQNGVGGWTFVWPANVKNASDISPDASSCSIQKFLCRSDGNLYPIGPMTYN